VTVLLIAIGAGLGAPARYLTDRALQARHETVFPWGTLTVNLIACLLLGFLTGAGSAISDDVSVLLGTGFCGALSTYSTFSYETMRLVQEGARFYAAANVAVSLVAGIGAAALGWSIGLSIT
jgi:fluoride exporter